MADEPATDNKASGAPAAEVLKPQDGSAAAAASGGAAPGPGAGSQPRPPHQLRRGPYRPSHKATFIGLAVVVFILAVNAGIIAFILKSQSKAADQTSQGQVTINQNALDKLGVNRTSIGDSGIELTVNPDAKFNGKLQVGGNVSIGGQLQVNSKFSAADASFTQLEAGKTSLSDLNVNGDGTLSNLNLRKNLIVAGTTTLQGSTVFAQLVTANSGLNVVGNLAVGGTLAVGSFRTGTLTVGGHVITAGSAPSVTKGNVGSAGTVSISGNDEAGTVAVNTGTGCGCSGVVATVTFRTNYTGIPHVVITPIGGGEGNVYVNRSSSGFSIGASLSSSGIYAFDYIVMQ